MTGFSNGHDSHTTLPSSSGGARWRIVRCQGPQLFIPTHERPGPVGRGHVPRAPATALPWLHFMHNEGRKDAVLYLTCEVSWGVHASVFRERNSLSGLHAFKQLLCPGAMPCPVHTAVLRADLTKACILYGMR